MSNHDTAQDLAQRVMVLCMEISRRGLADAFCDYHGHVDAVSIFAHPIGYLYSGEKDRVRIVNQTIHLKLDTNPISSLQETIEQLESILAAGQVIHIDDLRGAA